MTTAQRGPSAGRIVSLVIGCLVVLPALGMFIGGAALSAAYAFGRDDEGYFATRLDRFQTDTAAISSPEIDLSTDPGTPGWVIDALDADVRLEVTPVDDEKDMFLGIGPQSDVDAYLSTVGHDEVSDVDGHTPRYERRAGASTATPPDDEDFWSESVSGVGTQELVWEVQSGRWAVVLMNADGSAGVAADVEVGVKADVVLPVAVGLLVVGLLGLAVGVLLIVFGARGLGRGGRGEAAVGAPTTLPAPAETSAPASPVTVEATLDPELSQWMWLVKWFLAIPHFIVLFFLWIAVVVTTIISGFAILFTGRYPQGLFDFAVGVLRWTWRVDYYALHGGLGTDRYPPFSLAADDEYPARFDVDDPGELSRGLVLVKWWLLAIPQYMVVAVLLGGTWTTPGGEARAVAGLLPLLVFFAAVVLLFKGEYPRSLFDLVVGLNRWVLRVAAYAMLLTDEYPPFRLDQGPDEPDRDAPPVGAPPPSATTPTDPSWAPPPPPVQGEAPPAGR